MPQQLVKGDKYKIAILPLSNWLSNGCGRGLTAVEIAEKLQMPIRSVIKYAYNTNPIGLKFIRQIAEMLGIKPSDVIREVETWVPRKRPQNVSFGRGAYVSERKYKNGIPPKQKESAPVELSVAAPNRMNVMAFEVYKPTAWQTRTQIQNGNNTETA